MMRISPSTAAPAPPSADGPSTSDSVDPRTDTVAEAARASTPATGQGEAAAPTSDPTDKELKKLLHDYFSRAYDESVRRYLAAEATTRFTRIIIALIGAALFAAPFIKVILTPETDRQLIGQEEGQLFLLPGFLLMMIAFVPPLWRKGWPIPMALSIAVAALDLYVFQVGHVFIIWALLALAVGVLFWDIKAFLEDRRRPQSVKEFEARIDAWTQVQLRKLVETARQDLPIAPGRLTGDAIMVLKSFPKSDRLGKCEILARIGTDGVPRMSPVGLAAFDFGDKDVLIFEGAVDLATAQAVYLRLHQFSYDSISAVNWSSDVWPPDTGIAKRAAPAGASGAKSARSNPVLRRDELQIRLDGHHDITLVFRDGALAQRLEDRKFQRIEKMEHIKAVWQRLSRSR